MVNSVIEQSNGENWQLYNADCVEAVGNLPDDSVGFSVFSPPFASLYTYSNSERDMGNCADDGEFWTNFRFLIHELLRVTKPGRLVSVHCMQMPRMKGKDGFLGIRDFRGEIVACFEGAGFYYHSEVCIWKCPVVQMQRTKAIGLLHKQVCKDSTISRQGLADYVCTFRKPGENADPVAGELDYFAGDQSTFKSNGRLSIDVWQRYASPVWMDINPSNTLQYTTARDEEDERHICPLQLDVIERCAQLWSNPGDVVLSPFAGIGSEGHIAIKTGRKFVGVELKPSYYRIACQNMRTAEDSLREKKLF
jgi:DNA modification methylase